MLAQAHHFLVEQQHNGNEFLVWLSAINRTDISADILTVYKPYDWPMYTALIMLRFTHAQNSGRDGVLKTSVSVTAYYRGSNEKTHDFHKVYLAECILKTIV